MWGEKAGETSLALGADPSGALSESSLPQWRAQMTTPAKPNGRAGVVNGGHDWD